MDQVIKEHAGATKWKYCVYSGNNANLIRKQFENNLSDWEEISYEDEKQAMHLANFIWRQNDLTTYSNGIWENTNNRLRQHGFQINKSYPVFQKPVEPEQPPPEVQVKKSKKQRGESLAPPVPIINDHAPILRVVNHIDNFKMITMKTTILNTLKNYYGHLKDKVYDMEGNDNPHQIPFSFNYQSVRSQNEQVRTREHSSGGILSTTNTISQLNQNYKTQNAFGGPNVTIKKSQKSQSMNRMGPSQNLRSGNASGASGEAHSEDQEQLQNISERSNSQDSLKQNENRNLQRRSPDPIDFGGSTKIDQQIGELIKNNNLVEVFDILPTAFLLNPTMASEMNRFKKCFSDLHIGKGLSLYESVPEKHCKNNQWILKPAALNQGRGIQLFSKIRDIVTYINEQPPDSQWVVQKYIERPLLYKKRKFDIRMWSLVHIQDNPNQFDIYFFNEGYLRTSSQEYDINDENLYVHLTNNCLQVLDKSTFGQHEKGNTVSFDLFQTFLNEEYPDLDISIKEHLMPKMKDIVIDTIISVKSELNKKQRKYCFELLGYDFLIDEDFRLWLLEVNNNPFLGHQNDEQYKLLNHMISNMFAITLDPLIEGKTLKNNGKTDQFLEQKYELIYSDRENINMRGPYEKDNLYPIPSLNQFISRKEKEKIINIRRQQFNSQYRKKFEKKPAANQINYFDELKAQKLKPKVVAGEKPDTKGEENTNAVKITNQRKSYDFASTPNNKTPHPANTEEKQQFKKNLSKNFASQIQGKIEKSGTDDEQELLLQNESCDKTQTSQPSLKLRPNAESSFKNSKSINMKGHSVSGSTSQTSVMVLDKKLINFNTTNTISEKPKDGESSSKTSKSTGGRLKIQGNVSFSNKERKLLKQPIKGTSSISVNQKSQTATVSTTDIDPESQQAIIENPKGEEQDNPIIHAYKSQRNQSRINVSTQHVAQNKNAVIPSQQRVSAGNSQSNWNWNQSQSTNRKKFAQQNKATKASSIPPPTVPRYMPLIQQQKPKKLEVVQESHNSDDLPDINIRNVTENSIISMVPVTRDITPATLHKSPIPSTPMKFATQKKTQRTPIAIPIYEQQ